MDIIAALSAIGNGITVARTIRSIDKDFDAATFKMKIAEIMESLAEAKMALTDAKEALRERDEQISQLKASFQQRQALVVGRGDYKYIVDDAGAPHGYPICPKCEQTEGKIIQLKQKGNAQSRACCPVCGSDYHPVHSATPEPAREPVRVVSTYNPWRHS